MAKAPVNVEDLDFEQLDDQQLRVAMQRISETLHTRFTAKTQEYRELAREMGYAVTLTRIGKEEVVRRGRREGQEKDRRRSVAPKYRNPDNHAQTWSGRGREPQWYKNKIAAGATEESLLIDHSASQQEGPTPAPPG